jgi:hypothetical protein
VRKIPLGLRKCIKIGHLTHQYLKWLPKVGDTGIKPTLLNWKPFLFYTSMGYIGIDNYPNGVYNNGIGGEYDV